MNELARGGCSQDECAGLYPDRFYRNVSPSLRLNTFGCACACMSHTRARVSYCRHTVRSGNREYTDAVSRHDTKNHCVDTVRSSGY